jgi:DNA/RNA-binding domain of Phe-tRNA-synthetase-like protein
MLYQAVMTPSIDPRIWQLRPDFAALSLVATGVRNGPGADRVGGDLERPAWTEAHLAAWRDAYRAFGAKPQRTPCSAEALWRRVERDGGISGINAVVDLYNTVSLRFAVPVGGEDLASYRGCPHLTRARGDERFQTSRDGQMIDEVVDAGEVIWRDDDGVTCRRWNWRQTPRTRIDESSTTMWFVIERLEPMPLDSLHAAGEELRRGLLVLSPAAEIATVLLTAP